MLPRSFHQPSARMEDEVVLIKEVKRIDTRPRQLAMRCHVPECACLTLATGLFPAQICTDCSHPFNYHDYTNAPANVSKRKRLVKLSEMPSGKKRKANKERELPPYPQEKRREGPSPDDAPQHE